MLPVVVYLLMTHRTDLWMPQLPFSDEFKREAEKRRAVNNRINQEVLNGIKYGQATRKIKLAQNVIQKFEETKKLTVTEVHQIVISRLIITSQLHCFECDPSGY